MVSCLLYCWLVCAGIMESGRVDLGEIQSYEVAYEHGASLNLREFSQEIMAILTRGDKLNNPGNIVHGDPWQGLADDQPDPKFAKFKTPAWGFRAMAVTLVTYQDRYGIKTINGIVSRWAPKSDNNNDPAYVANVVKNSGFGADEAIDLHNYNDAYKILRAITIQEQGGFEGIYTKAQLDTGCIKAGLQGAPRGVVVAAVKVTTAGAAAAAAAAASDPGSVLNAYNILKPIVDVGPDFIKHGFWCMVGFGIVGLAIGEFNKIRNAKG